MIDQQRQQIFSDGFHAAKSGYESVGTAYMEYLKSIEQEANSLTEGIYTVADYRRAFKEGYIAGRLATIEPLVKMLKKIVNLKNAALSTQDLFPVLQSINEADELLSSWQANQSSQPVQDNSGWINCDDNLPSPWTPCLVWCISRYGTKEGIYSAATISRDPVDKLMRGLDAYNRGIYYITHWMQLPTPPNQ